MAKILLSEILQGRVQVVRILGLPVGEILRLTGFWKERVFGKGSSAEFVIDNLNEVQLNAKEWANLKLAIRKRRERLGRHAELKTVTISTKALEVLAKISERDEVTYSHTLEHYLSAAFNAKSRKLRSPANP